MKLMSKYRNAMMSVGGCPDFQKPFAMIHLRRYSAKLLIMRNEILMDVTGMHIFDKLAK